MNIVPSAPWEIAGYLEGRNGRLCMDGIDLSSLAEERATPLYVYSSARIRSTARDMLQVFSAQHPRAQICYASKALSTIKVLRLLRDEGLQIEVNSGGELFRAMRAGYSPDAVIFNGVAKSAAEIREALSPPIKSINVDSLFELGRIAEIASGMKCRARIALRVVPEVNSPTSPGNQTGAELTKFGIRKSEIAAALEVIRAHGEALVLCGLHCHIGSQIADTASYLLAAERLAGLFGEVRATLGYRLQHLNIGGGFPLVYLRGNAPWQDGIFAPGIDYPDIAAAVLPLLRRSLGEDVEIIVEPGRRMVGDAAVLLSRVENIKQRTNGSWLYLDAGYNTIVESYTYKWYYHAVTANKLAEPLGPFRLVGPLCDNGDAFHDVDGEQIVDRLAALDGAFSQRRELLERVLIRMPPRRHLAASTSPGDIVAFLDAGAYTLDQLTPNNGRPRPEVGLIGKDGRYSLLRQRDSYEDLLFNEVI